MDKPFAKCITARFTIKDYMTLQHMAEEEGCSIAEVLRSLLHNYKRHTGLTQLLLRMEQRQKSDYFNTLCAVLNLSDEEIEKTKETLKLKGVKL